MSMGDMGGMAEKAEDAAIEKGGDAVDDRTGGKFSGQVDQAQQKADEMLGGDQQQ